MDASLRPASLSDPGSERMRLALEEEIDVFRHRILERLGVSIHEQKDQPIATVNASANHCDTNPSTLGLRFQGSSPNKPIFDEDHLTSRERDAASSDQISSEEFESGGFYPSKKPTSDTALPTNAGVRVITPPQSERADPTAFYQPTRASTSSQAREKRKSMQAPDMMEGALAKARGKAQRSRKSISDSVFRKVIQPEMSLETKYFRESHPVRGPIRVLVLHPLFDTFFGLVVITSVAFLGAEIEMTAHNYDLGVKSFLIVQCICCFFFILEILMRFVAFDRGFFGLGRGSFVRMYKWNAFDLLCTLAMIVDLSIELTIDATGPNTSRDVASQTRQGRILRFFRLMRIIRALRVLRMVEFARELRKMSYALQYSFHTLLWAMLLLSFVIYFFATAFTQATTEAIIAAGNDPIAVEELQILTELYGTIPAAYLSLFQSVTAGRDWHECVEPLAQHTHWMNQVLFICYIAMTIFGVMNVITSVFVESALASVQHYKDLLIQENTKNKEVYVTHLRDVFACLDFDNSGEISIDEMDSLLHDAALQQYLESMEIHPEDAQTLFKLLDCDDSGQVNIAEFCKGCLKLKGDAKSYDVHCLLYENSRLIHKWQQYMDYLEKGFLPELLSGVTKCVESQVSPLRQHSYDHETPMQRVSMGLQESLSAMRM